MKPHETIDLHGKQAHIIGMARSGLAAAEVLHSLGAEVILHDRKDSAALSEALILADSLGVESRTGATAYSGIISADLVVTSPGVPDTCSALIDARDHDIPVWPEIELAYRISPAPIIAVTGTNGKTTTTALIGEIIRRSGMHAFIAGNIVAGDIRLPLVKAAAQASSADVIVAEISSFQLESISSFRPAVGALLNISADHLDRHPDLDTYARLKARLFEYQNPDDTAVLNADDPRLQALLPGIGSRLLLFSRHSEVNTGTFARGSEVWWRTPCDEAFVCDTASMKLRGIHNLENVLAASAAVLAFGIGSEQIQSAIESFEPLQHRLEPVGEIAGVEFLNNSMCTNVAAAVSSLEAIGRPAIVIAGGKDKGSDYMPLGEAFVRHAKHVVLIGKDAPLIEAAAQAAGFHQISHADSMENAVDKAWQFAERGDSIVLSPGCASFDMFKDFEDRGRVFKSAVVSLVERVRGCV
jgi:UDP-N-acetylmuramoylalanine--D-glutamate ligase